MIDKAHTLFCMRAEAASHPTKPLRLDGSQLPYEDLVAWFIRERYSPWTEPQMINYQDTMVRIARNFDQVMKRKNAKLKE